MSKLQKKGHFLGKISVQGNFTHITKIWHSKNTPYTTDARLAGKQAAASHPANAALPRLAKIGKTCGVGRGKVYLNPLKIRPLSVPIRFVRQ